MKASGDVIPTLMGLDKRNYIIVSPVRNEGAYFRQTLDSIVGQTISPLRWVIVDDGSVDDTRKLAENYAVEYPWIQIASRKDRGFRQSGIGVAEAFYEGFAHAKLLPWEYVVKLDGDIRLPSTYFEELANEFERDPKLGITSGDIYNDDQGTLVLDSPGDPAFHVRGAAKIYRRACWEAIGGLPKVTGFDCVDNLKARMLGWDTRRFPRPAVIHLRKTGQATGRFRNGIKDGIGANAIGYHPAFMLIKCAKRFATGNLPTAFGQFCGYLKGYFSDIPRIEDRAVINYIRTQQWNRLLGRPSIWR